MKNHLTINKSNKIQNFNIIEILPRRLSTRRITVGLLEEEATDVWDGLGGLGPRVRRQGVRGETKHIYKLKHPSQQEN